MVCTDMFKDTKAFSGFAADDLDAAVSAVKDGDGEVMAGPIDVPAGAFALVADPQGAVFAIFHGELQD